MRSDGTGKWCWCSARKRCWRPSRHRRDSVVWLVRRDCYLMSLNVMAATLCPAPCCNCVFRTFVSESLLVPVSIILAPFGVFFTHAFGSFVVTRTLGELCAASPEMSPEEVAASRIAAAWRMYSAFTSRLILIGAVTLIASCWRRFVAVRRYRAMLAEVRSCREQHLCVLCSVRRHFSLGYNTVLQYSWLYN